MCLKIERNFCSEEEMLKKLGDLMDASHYSCSVLFECRYIYIYIYIIKQNVKGIEFG